MSQPKTSLIATLIKISDCCDFLNRSLPPEKVKALCESTGYAENIIVQLGEIGMQLNQIAKEVSDAKN